jgi:hypothetical protein
MATGYPYINEYLYNITTQQVVNLSDGSQRFAIRNKFDKKTSKGDGIIYTGVFLNESYQHISAVLAHDYHSKGWVLVHNYCGGY